MRSAVLGGSAIAVLAVAALAATWGSSVFADRIASPSVTPSGGVIVQTTSLPDNRQQVVLVDPELRVMSVYSIEPRGEIVLKSVRNFRFDLQMLEFNSEKPSPQEIRSLLEAK